MRRLLAAALSVLLLSAAPAPRAAPLAVEVVRDGARWTAELSFQRRARVWAFVRSPLTEETHQPWRPQSWQIETPGVRLERHGFYDALVAADGGLLPDRIRIRFTPFPDRVAGDYDPALVFTDGSVALYSEQFDAFPAANVAMVERLPADISSADIVYSATRVTFRDAAGPILYGGRRVSSTTIETDEDGGYVLFGPARPIVTPAMALVIDPALPQWIHDSIAAATPGILDRYAAALGPAPGPKPTIMVSWVGPTAGRRSMGGGTLAGLIVMRFEGEGMLAGSPAAQHSNLWFIAHESAHFWLGQAVHYGTALDSWITEGGADLLAFRAVAAADPSYDARAELQKAVDDCARLSAGRGIATALERNEHRAYYACGAVFALVAEAASHRPFIQFVRQLLDASRADRTVTRADWLGLLDRLSRDPSLSRDMAAMLDRGSADPKALIASLFTRAGIAFTRAADGTPRLS
jgi:hypothetical protein